MNKPIISEILSVVDEAFNIRTITFSYPCNMIPGQFFMVWIPGIDEIPMSVSIIEKDIKGITFRDVGDATHELFQMKKGDKIGIRGPYGNGFSISGEQVLIIGGGTGIAMIAPMVETCLQNNMKVDVVFGAKSKNELFFINRIQKTEATTHIATDDGSEGFHGFASECVKTIIKQKKIDYMFSCGPELMMKALLQICNDHDISYEASLERYMKCAVGICGQCCIGEGLRVCVEGPVFNKKYLEQIDDFGHFTRNASGTKIKID
jgi:dihydroorotate dehydrogenase electron transfer subunit